MSIDLKEKLGTQVKKEEESKAGSGGADPSFLVETFITLTLFRIYEN